MMKLKQIIKRAIDLHVHVGPEPIPRRFTPSTLVEAETGNLRGVALKNHFYPTTPMIKALDAPTDLVLIGSVTLNNYVGGLNADVIYATAKLSENLTIVWFPTINAYNYLRKSKYEIRPEWVNKKFRSRLSGDVKGIRIIAKNKKLTYPAKIVLKEIRDNGCILATGHISWQESRALIYEAVGLGINKIIVTHPLYQLINMPLKIQKELVKLKGVYIEQCYSMYSIDQISIRKIVKGIREVGANKCIISSDVGQITSPSPSVALQKFSELLKKGGIGDEELEIMCNKNPRALVS